jgi:serine/threonine protein kinase
MPLNLTHPNLSDSAKDLIKKMLTKKVSDRIKPEAIKAHPFFAPIDFKKLLMKNVEAPFKPKIVIKKYYDLKN